MTKDDTRMAVFGSFDGLTSAVGVVLAALLTSSDVVAVTLALAVTNAVSMAAGEWLADDVQDAHRLRRAAVMGIATLLGSAAPAVPYLVAHGALANVLCGALIVLLTCAIAEIRPGDRWPSYVKTFIVIAVASALAALAALLGQAVAG